MTAESILQLINLARSGQCSIQLSACTTGVVANVTAVRDELTLATTVYLDRNDPEIEAKLNAAVHRVQ